jgi:hypothetical protein
MPGAHCEGSIQTPLSEPMQFVFTFPQIVVSERALKEEEKWRKIWEETNHQGDRSTTSPTNRTPRFKLSNFQIEMMYQRQWAMGS